MAEQAIPARLSSESLAIRGRDRWRRRLRPLAEHGGWVAAVGVLLAAVLFVVLTRMRPEYDAYGWLVWGKQALHWNLDTNGAPSWKPLTFLFTLPYALFGRAQPWLWMVTSVAAALAGAVFSGRIAFRLSGPGTGHTLVRVLGALFAGAAILGLEGYWHLMLIANSDPMVMALCLAAIDCHLGGRRRLAFLMLVLASLGRPEAWLFALAYGVWLAWSTPGMRIPVALAVIGVPLVWFGVSALTSHSWLRAGELALNSPRAVHGNKIIGVPRRLADLYEWPMRLAVLAALVLAVVRRERTALALAGAAFLWVAVEIAFALHGWSAVPRLLIEPAAVLIAVTGGAIGLLLSGQVARSALVRWAGAVAVLVLIVALVPVARNRARTLHTEVDQRRQAGTYIDRLEKVIDREGGASRIRACGQPVTVVGWQSTLAWYVDLNVGDVGYKPGRAIHKGNPIVLFKPFHLGWQVRPVHTSSANATTCQGLRTDTDFG